MSSRRICFVANELAPFTRGGLGTWLRNTLRAYSTRETKFEVLFYGDRWLDTAAFSAEFPGVALLQVKVADNNEQFLASGQPGRGVFASWTQWRSYVLMRALERRERETGPYHVVEFTDWYGSAYYTLQQKKTGRSFQSTVVSIRLHGAETMMRRFETRPWHVENLMIADCERKALRDADVVVAHLASTAELYQQSFGFEPGWRDRVIVNRPPVEVAKRSPHAIHPDRETAIVFSSKLQMLKRPDIFVRGGCAFLAGRDDYRGRLIFAAFSVDESLHQRITQEIPPHLKDRVVFLGELSPASRDELISSSVVVFPNAVETFCFAAYEASIMGAVVVLNSNNHAFGEGTPWVDRVNCRKFDGTSRDLVSVLNEILAGSSVGNNTPLVAVPAAHEPVPYWETIHLATRMRRSSPPALTVIVVHQHQKNGLAAHVSRILEGNSGVEIIRVDRDTNECITRDLSATPRSSALHPSASIETVRLSIPGSYAAAVNAALDRVRTPLVAVLPLEERPLPGFVSDAVRCFELNPDLGMIVPAARIVAELGDVEPLTYRMPLAEPIHTGLFVKWGMGGSFVCRTELLQQFRMDERLTCEWNWDFALRLAYAGHRILAPADPSIECAECDVAAHDWRNEAECQHTMETMRSRLAMTGRDICLSLGIIGDGQHASHSRYDSMPIKPKGGKRESTFARWRKLLRGAWATRS